MSAPHHHHVSQPSALDGRSSLPPANRVALQTLSQLSSAQFEAARFYNEYIRNIQLPQRCVFNTQDISREMERVAANQAKISRDVPRILREIVPELIGIITSESIERVLASNRDVLTGDDIIDSFRAYGFPPEYVNILEHRLLLFRLAEKTSIPVIAIPSSGQVSESSSDICSTTLPQSTVPSSDYPVIIPTTVTAAAAAAAAAAAQTVSTGGVPSSTFQPFGTTQSPGNNTSTAAVITSSSPVLLRHQPVGGSHNFNAQTAASQQPPPPSVHPFSSTPYSISGFNSNNNTSMTSFSSKQHNNPMSTNMLLQAGPVIVPNTSSLHKQMLPNASPLGSKVIFPSSSAPQTATAAGTASAPTGASAVATTPAAVTTAAPTTTTTATTTAATAQQNFNPPFHHSKLHSPVPISQIPPVVGSTSVTGIGYPSFLPHNSATTLFPMMSQNASTVGTTSALTASANPQSMLIPSGLAVQISDSSTSVLQTGTLALQFSGASGNNLAFQPIRRKGLDSTGVGGVPHFCDTFQHSPNHHHHNTTINSSVLKSSAPLCEMPLQKQSSAILSGSTSHTNNNNTNGTNHLQMSTHSTAVFLRDPAPSSQRISPPPFGSNTDRLHSPNNNPVVQLSTANQPASVNP